MKATSEENSELSKVLYFKNKKIFFLNEKVDFFVVVGIFCLFVFVEETITKQLANFTLA